MKNKQVSINPEVHHKLKMYQVKNNLKTLSEAIKRLLERSKTCD